MWKFETSMTWQGQAAGEAECAGKPSVRVSAPPEFGGEPDQWTPEDLLLSAIESCLLMTAVSVLTRQKINLKAYRSHATGTMEKTPEGLRFTGLDIAVELQVGEAAEIEKAERAMGIAEKYCPVSNAVKFPVHLTAKATVA